jgi:hypothetical protein
VKFHALSLVFLSSLCSAVLADPPTFNDVEEREVAPWKEDEYSLPAFPKDENLIEFHVSAASSAKYYIDHTSIGAGTQDNVVRYAMVVKTAGGATNISYEGIRCDANEFRIYATGNQEGAWLKARRTEWRKFERYSPQQKALANNYFCPSFSPVKTAAEGVDALKRGVHPIVRERYQ